jgi:superfamily I DNA/RNA helicase
MQNLMIAQMDPDAVSPADQLAGDDGVIEVLSFDTASSEAQAIAQLIDTWLTQDVPPHEIAVLVRQQPHLVAAELSNELAQRVIPFRNEQDSQDLTAEPVAALILNFLRVVADDRQPDAYAELMAIADRQGVSQDEAARFDSQVKRMIGNARASVRQPEYIGGNSDTWRTLVHQFLRLVTRPVLTALSSGYQQGSRLDDLVDQTLDAFDQELAIDADAAKALRRLSEIHAVRFLTIHKCKGLEFQKVVVLGVERQLFWGDPTAAISEFFVAISRAKQHLVLTVAARRGRPDGAIKRWDEQRTPYREFLDFADE